MFELTRASGILKIVIIIFFTILSDIMLVSDVNRIAHLPSVASANSLLNE